MSDKIGNKIIRWWLYPSFFKFFGIAILCMVLSFLCAYFIPNLWCLIGVFTVCGIGGYFMRKMLPQLLRDLGNEMSS
jgi:MFS family permease